jgi:PTH1 family peptidyl-tRNA hydrolase
VVVLRPQTYYNDAGRSVGPARGAFKLPLERVLVVHDEIDLPFDEVRTRLGGGLAGNNGLKSIKRELGGADFMRVRVGVGRPDSTDPEIVASYVLGRFRESAVQVAGLVDHGREHVERAVLGAGTREAAGGRGGA